jgi:four helix bundle protein
MRTTSNLNFGEQFKNRTKQFALRVITLFRALPKTDEAKVIGKQLLRSATSVAANYRAACRARSNAEFYAKICIVVEEADETVFWLELLEESGIFPKEKLALLQQEADAITSICIKTRSTLRKASNTPNSCTP